MKQTVIAFTGISGVGKTTFLRGVAEEIEFQHLTAGSLIAAARAMSEADRDVLRHADLDENQRLLVVGFAQARNPETPIIIMDGHVIIDGPNGITEIDGKVFSDLGINQMVHPEAEPSRILKNREADDARIRPAMSADDLEMHQEWSRRRAATVADLLGIEFVRVTYSECASFVNRLSGYVRYR